MPIDAGVPGYRLDGEVTRLVARVSLVVCFALVVQARAGHPNLRFDILKTDDGLPQNSIVAIVQTRDGYLWLATTDGLARYDGVRFTVFDRASTPGIASNRFSTLFEDSRGTLWAGTEEGYLTEYRNGQFASHPETRVLGQILHIAETRDGEVWLVANGSLGWWSDARLELHRPQDLAPEVTGPWTFQSGAAWAQDAAGLHCFVRGELASYAAGSALPDLPVRSVHCDARDTLWVVTADHTLHRIRGGRATSYRLPPGVVGEAGTTLAFEDSDGGLWIANPTAFVTYVRDGVPVTYDRRDNIETNSVASFYQDREGTVWLGTLDGLRRVRHVAFRTVSESDGLSSDNVYSILEDRSGTVWVGTWGGGLNAVRDGAIVKYYAEDGLMSNRILALFEDRDGRIWVGAHGGMNVIEDGRIAPFATDLDLTNVYAIHRDVGGAMWLATDRGVVRIVDGKSEAFTVSDGLPGVPVTAIVEDREETIWF
jgi:ligand-binding sensor domain-containing protein